LARVRGLPYLVETRQLGGGHREISSIAERQRLGSSLAYLAAKAGVDALKIRAREVTCARKIRVFRSRRPAWIRIVAGRSREKLQKIAEKVPLAHVTTPDDVARAGRGLHRQPGPVRRGIVVPVG